MAFQATAVIPTIHCPKPSSRFGANAKAQEGVKNKKQAAWTTFPPTGVFVTTLCSPSTFQPIAGARVLTRVKPRVSSHMSFGIRQACNEMFDPANS